MYSDDIRKAKAHLKLKLAIDVKGNKKGSYRNMGSKKGAKENGPAGDLVDTKKAEVLNVISVSVFTALRPYRSLT